MQAPVKVQPERHANAVTSDPQLRVGRCAGNSGFSILELVIVIVIIGVIAAIVIPRISAGAQGAGEAGLRADLAVLRSAVELYAAEHGGDYPAAQDAGSGAPAGTSAAFTTQMTLYTDANGKAAVVQHGQYIYGPYLPNGIPPLKVGVNRGSDTVGVVPNGPAVDVAGGYGWVYAYETGEIIANADQLDQSQTKTYDQY